MRRTFVLLPLAGALALPAAAGADRPPTFREREALTAAQPASLRSKPVGCVYLAIAVSDDGRWAKVEPRYLNATRPRSPCVRYAANGFALYRRTQAGWRKVYTGSEPPSCALRAPRDLIACRRR